MNTEQLTMELIALKERQTKLEYEQNTILDVITDLKTDIKTTKALAEDVHIMAINMENMKKTLDDTNKKVDALNNKDFEEYKDTKKQIKGHIISAIAGAGGTFVIGLISWLIQSFINKGGM